MILNKMISEIEAHTGQTFDLNNRRHRVHLASKIKNQHSDRLRKLALVEKALDSTGNENDIYCDTTHYLQKRYKD